MNFFSKSRYYILFSILILHLSLIVLRGYFLSIEFTLYPFLSSHGFLPYRNILDQHFPTLLFGPFSLPSFLTTNPLPLLAVFLVTLCSTDLFFYASLVRFKVRQPFVWLIFYIVSSTYFSGNILWFETFINFLLAAWFFLSFSPSRLSKVICGLLLSQIILLRPTVIPALLFLFLGFSSQFSVFLLGGLLIGLFVPGLYLFRHGLIPDFYRLAIDFNQHVYPHKALLLPAKRQIVYLICWLALPIYDLLKKKQTFSLLALASLLLFIYPRFGFEHLQPLFLCATLLWAIKCQPIKILIYFLIFIIFCLNLVPSIRHPYGNYFLNQEIKDISTLVRNLPGNQIYLLGASDIIYPLSGKIPPNFTYLPSLPWYFSQTDFVDRVIHSLSTKDTPVLLDYSASIDGVNIVESSNWVFEYIRINFTPGEKIGHYQFFYPNHENSY